MRWLWTAFLSLGAGFALAAGCSEGTDDPGAGGATTTTGGVGGQGGTLTCDADFVDLLGATAECSTCMNGFCCEESMEYESAPSRATFLALQMCASTTAGISPCFDQCDHPVCGNEGLLKRHVPLLHDCAECVTANCCAEWDACEADAGFMGGCNNCLSWTDFVPAKCCGIPRFDALDECLDTQCASECAQPVWYDCSGGGWGGTGGTGGAGGSAGGAGGAGGSAGGAGGSGGGVTGGGGNGGT